MFTLLIDYEKWESQNYIQGTARHKEKNRAGTA
jgi:hypothetical protein